MSFGDGRARRVRQAWGALVTALAFGCAPDPEPPRAALPNVIVVSFDTTRADHFGFLGNPNVRTPRLDALANESLVFEDFVTVVPTTLASHASLFSGRYPHHHGTPRNGFMVNQANEMLPEILQRAGYRTIGFPGSFALDSRFDFAQGFERYEQEFDVLVAPGGIDQNQRTATQLTDSVIQFLDEGEIAAPLFLFVHYFDPHRPYAAPPPFARSYDPPGAGALPPIESIQLPAAFEPDERATYAHRHALRYAEEISYMDHEFGRLIDALRVRGVLADAILSITSDHGESFLEHDEKFDHGRCVYDETVRALWLLRLPRARLGGTRLRHPASSVDVLPTLLAELGLAPPPGIDGVAIPLDPADDRLDARDRFGQATKPHTPNAGEGGWENIDKARFVRRGRFKLIQTPYLDREELYDVVADPGETRDLLPNASPEIDALAARLRTALEAWANSADPLPSHYESSQLEETVERLRSLGYVE